MDEIEHARGNSNLVKDLGHDESMAGSLAGGLHDHGATRGHGRSNFSDDLMEGVVPLQNGMGTEMQQFVDGSNQMINYLQQQRQNAGDGYLDNPYWLGHGHHQYIGAPMGEAESMTRSDEARSMYPPSAPPPYESVETK